MKGPARRGSSLAGMETFAVLYEYPADSEQIAAVRPRHREFLGGLKKRGLLVGSGPFTDADAGALIVVRLPQPAEVADARTLMDEDPFWQESLLTGRTIRPWNPVLNVFGD